MSKLKGPSHFCSVCVWKCQEKQTCHDKNGDNSRKSAFYAEGNGSPKKSRHLLVDMRFLFSFAGNVNRSSFVLVICLGFVFMLSSLHDSSVNAIQNLPTLPPAEIEHRDGQRSKQQLAVVVGFMPTG